MVVSAILCFFILKNISFKNGYICPLLMLKYAVWDSEWCNLTFVENNDLNLCKLYKKTVRFSTR